MVNLFYPQSNLEQIAASDAAQSKRAEVNGRPLRVLLYAAWFAEYATRLALALREHCQVLLIVREGGIWNECALPHEGMANIEILRQPIGDPDERVADWIAARALEFLPDIIHVQESADDITLKVVTLLSRWRRLVMTVHDPAPHSGRDAAFMASRLSYFTSLRSAAFAFHIHGEHCRRLLSETHGHCKPTVSTAIGVHLVPAPESVREPEPHRLLFFGRMEAYKGVEEVLEACNILRERNAPVHVVLAGAGSELERLDTLIQANAGQITVIDRYLSPAEAVEQFQRALAVVIPYRDANQSGVAVAAFANGRPVIATAVKGLVESVRHGVDGLLVDPGDIKGLVDAMEAVVNSPELWQRLAKGARESARGRFSWDTIAGTLVQAYVSLLGYAPTERQSFS